MPDKPNSFASMPSVDTFDEQRLLAEVESSMFGTGSPVRLGRYLLGARLGAGGMGVVYEAEDPHLDRKVALKVLHPDRRFSHPTRGHQRLREEARSGSQVSHPNVVEIFDVGEAEGRVYIAMELVTGSSLDVWLSQPGRRWSEIVRVFVDAGRGLAAAHAAGLIHRDFKPSNVSIDREGRVRVLDFGLAKAHVDGPRVAEASSAIDAAPSSCEAGLVGTPKYMAPEQLQGEPGTQRSDQYAFCLSLFEALFGRPPFREREMLASKLAEDRIAPPPGHTLPRQLVRALHRGLRADPERRWATMDALLARLEAPAGPRPTALVVGAIAVLATSLAVGWTEPSAAEADSPSRTEHPRSKWDDALTDALALRRQRDYEGASEVSRRVLDEARRYGDRRTAARAARALGQALIDMGRLDEGLEILEQGHTDAVVARADDTRAVIAAIIGLAVVQRGGVAAAERWQRDARSIAAEHPVSDDTRLGILAMEGQVAWHAGDGEAAIDFATRAFELARRKKLPHRIDTALNLSRALFLNGRLEEAKAATLELLEEARASSEYSDVEIADTYMLLGAIEAGLARKSNSERFEDAIEHGRRAVETYQRIPNLPTSVVSRAEFNLGNVLHDAGEYAESNALYEQSLRRLRAGSAPQENLVVGLETGMGGNLAKLDDFDGAQTHLHRAMLTLEELFGREHPALHPVLLNLAIAQRESGAWTQAAATLERALALPNVLDHERAAGFWDAARLARLDGRDEDAATFVQHAAAAYERSGDLRRAREVRAWGAEDPPG